MNTENTDKKNGRLSGDTIGKIIVIAVFVLFALLSFFALKKPAGAAGMGGMPGGAAMGGAPGAGAMDGAPGTGAAGAGDGKPAANTITVSAKKMKSETIQKTIRINGDVESKTKVNAYPDTAGKITELPKGLGDSVKKGDIIAYVNASKPGSFYASSPVLAPVSGTIISMNVSVGDTVSAGNIVAEVGSLSDLEITVYVSEKYSAFLKNGLPAYLSITSLPDERFNCRVTQVSPVVNAANRTIEVNLELDKYDDRIKPGMFAGVDLVIQQSSNTMVIPKTALKTYNDENVVFTIDENNVARRKTVKTGISNDSYIEIKSGVSAGDVVVTAGSVTDGTPVRIAGEE